MLPASGKFGLNRYVTSNGSLGYFDVDETQTAKFVITNAAPGNIFTIKGKIQGQSSYTPIDTIIGSITKTIDITQYDYIEVECTTYVSQSTYVQIDGSGFATSLVNSPMGDINVSISLNPGEDGVYVGDKTTGVPLKVNNDGSINVVTSTTASATKYSYFNEVLAVSAGATATLVNYTVPVGKDVVLDRVFVSGDNIAKYELYLNGNLIDKARTYFGSSPNVEFNFYGLKLAVGDVVSAKVVNFRSSVSDFNGRIQITEL